MNDEDDERKLDDQLDEDQDTSRASGDDDQTDDDDKSQQGKGDDDLDDDSGKSTGDDDDSEDTDKRQSRRERRAQRYHDMFDDMREGFSARDNARTRLSSQSNDQYNPLDYASRDEFDPKQLQDDRQKFGEQRAREAQQMERFWNDQDRFQDKLETDSDFVANRYEFMDKDDENFDPELSKQVNDLYLSTVGFDQKTGIVQNPRVRYKDFVKNYVGALDRFAAARNADSSKNIARQRSRTGIRPTGGGSKGQSSIDQLLSRDPKDLSDKELDRVYAAIQKR